MNSNLGPQKFIDFCDAHHCNRDAYDVQELLGGDFSGEVGKVAIEVIKSNPNWPEVVEALKALGISEQKIEEKGVELLANYLTNETNIAWNWRDSANATFKETVAKVIEDGISFIKYLRMLKLEEMTYKEFERYFGCENNEGAANTKLFEENADTVALSASRRITCDYAWPSICEILMIDPGNPTEEELKYFFDQIIEYLKEIDFIGVWKNFDYDRTFIDVLVKVIGDCFGFINFLENNGDM